MEKVEIFKDIFLNCKYFLINMGCIFIFRGGYLGKEVFIKKIFFCFYLKNWVFYNLVFNFWFRRWIFRYIYTKRKFYRYLG